MDTAELAAIATTHRVHRTFAFVDLCGFTDFVDLRAGRLELRGGIASGAVILREGRRLRRTTREPRLTAL